jgi:hypothetical protein
VDGPVSPAWKRERGGVVFKEVEVGDEGEKTSWT